jgi:flagellin
VELRLTGFRELSLLSIFTNLDALGAQSAISSSTKSISTAMQRLSTGKQLNSAADDAAGIAIYNSMNSQIMSYAAALNNIHQVVGINNQMSGDLQNINNILIEMKNLALSSASSTSSQTDRNNNQALYTQYRAQIDSIANSSTFNNNNLLNGSMGLANFQVGINADSTFKESLPNALSTNLGVVAPIGLSSSGSSTNPIALGDLVINGYSVPASQATSDNLSFALNSGSSIAKATAINSISSNSGVSASVGANLVSGTSVVSSATASSGSIALNGQTISINQSTTNSLAANRQLVVSSINASKGLTGVIAIDSGDSAHGIYLQSNDGRNITISYDGNLTPANTGLANSGTYSGGITLRSTNGNPMVISSSSSGNISDVGFNPGVYSASSAIFTTAKRNGSTAAPITLTGNDLVINGYAISAPQASSDTSTQPTTTSATKVASAISLAAAINALSNTTNVTAVADPNVLTGIGFQAGNVDSIFLNGSTINANLTSASTVNNVVSLLNQKVGLTGVSASSNGSGITLTASDGRTISIGASYQGGVVDGATLGMSNLLGQTAPLATSDNAISFVSTVTLSSTTPFMVNSGGAGNSNFTALGFKNGTFGASSDIVTLAKQNIQTQSSAKNAINVINSAINWVSNQQAAIGGVLNSMDYQASFLNDSKMNLQISENSLVGTDFAQTTTQLAKSQIIQQAATAMLAQANVSSQLVLTLLKH